MRSFSELFTLCSKFEYACTTYQCRAIRSEAPWPVILLVTYSKKRSSNQKNTPMIRANTITAIVVWIVSSRVGQTTLRSSMRAAWMNFQSDCALHRLQRDDRGQPERDEHAERAQHCDDSPK